MKFPFYSLVKILVHNVKVIFKYLLCSGNLRRAPFDISQWLTGLFCLNKVDVIDLTWVYQGTCTAVYVSCTCMMWNREERLCQVNTMAARFLDCIKLKTSLKKWISTAVSNFMILINFIFSGQNLFINALVMFFNCVFQQEHP